MKDVNVLRDFLRFRNAAEKFSLLVISGISFPKTEECEEETNKESSSFLRYPLRRIRQWQRLRSATEPFPQSDCPRYSAPSERRRHVSIRKGRTVFLCVTMSTRSDF